METKTLFVQIETRDSETVFVLTNAPPDGEDQIRALQPGVPLNTVGRRIHATEAEEYLSVWNSDESMNEGERATDIRQVALKISPSFIERDYAEGINDVRYQASFV